MVMTGKCAVKCASGEAAADECGFETLGRDSVPRSNHVKSIDIMFFLVFFPEV